MASVPNQPHSAVTSAIVARLDACRREQRVSYTELGDAAGLSEAQTRKILQGKDNKVLTVDVLVAVCRRLGLVPEDVVRQAMSLTTRAC